MRTIHRPWRHPAINAASVSGIYRIVNLRDGKLYIGSAVNVRARLRCHRNLLLYGRHDNAWLQRAWSRDGEESFQFEQLTSCDKCNLIQNERWWIDYYRKHGTPLYNLRPIVDSQLGVRFSDESRAKMREAKRVTSTDTRERMAASARRFRDEHPGYYKGTGMGRIPWNKGKKTNPKFSDEARAKISRTHIGNQYNRGRKPSGDTLAKRSKSLAAAWTDSETRDKHILGLKSAWAKKTPEERSAIGLKSWETRRRNSASSLQRI